MARDERAYLADIIDACDAITTAVRGLDLHRYEGNRLVRSSVEREFIIIGEALAVLNRVAEEIFTTITMFGLLIPGLIGGSVIIEKIFSWPGLGRLAYEAILNRDFPVILTTGFSFSWDEPKYRDSGIQALVKKPIVARELASAVRNVLDKEPSHV